MTGLGNDPLIGTVLADRYRIEKRLGHGGMGAVYLAEHVHMKKPFAVKVLHREMGQLSEAVFRFEREAVAAGRVDHEHLVTATDFGQLPDGSRYLVLEYVPGKNLSALIGEGPLPAVRALAIARQMAAALSAIHAVGIVHRDVKPDNVMLVERAGNEDFVKLLDFGMAKVQQEQANAPQVTRQGLVFGTPRYMAPEQAAGEPTDHRADLYALGIVLYAMLAGNPPFSAEEIRDVLRMQRYDPPPPLPSSVHPWVAAFVMTMLEKDPGRRIQTADGVVEYIDGLLTRLDAESRSGKHKWAAFFRKPAGIVAAVVIALAVFALVFGLVRHFKRSIPTASSAIASGSAAPSGAETALETALVRAEVGDSEAWRSLEGRPDRERGAREWFVLGVARVTHRETAKGMDAYLHAAEADAHYATHPRVLHDLVVATRGDAWEPALRAAAALPDPAGADILFDVWASTPRATPATQRARDLLASDVVGKRASDALRIAVDLRTAQGHGCESRKPLVERAVAAADARAFRPLVLLLSHTCGARKDEDCFPCLRGDDALDRAIERAKTHPGPDFSKLAGSDAPPLHPAP